MQNLALPSSITWWETLGLLAASCMEVVQNSKSIFCYVVCSSSFPTEYDVVYVVANVIN